MARVHPDYAHGGGIATGTVQWWCYSNWYCTMVVVLQLVLYNGGGIATGTVQWWWYSNWYCTMVVV